MTRTRTWAAITALALTMLMSACGGGSQSLTSPSPSAPSPSVPTTTSGRLWGVVFEITAGTLVGLEGVEVYCDTCGPVGHSHRFTDGTGEYDFGEVPNGRPLLVLGAKFGYSLLRPDEAIAGWMGSIRATVSGASRFNIELVRR
jgi:hypothetical protein